MVLSRDQAQCLKMAYYCVSLESARRDCAALMPCSACANKMERHSLDTTTLWHLSAGMDQTKVEVGSVFVFRIRGRQREAYGSCSRTYVEGIPLKADGLRATVPLLDLVWGLPSLGQILKVVPLMIGLHKNTVEGIDSAGLECYAHILAVLQQEVYY